MEIIELTILTNNIYATERFYSRRLGLPISQKNENSISFKTQTSTLSFKKTKIKVPSYHFAFNIPNNQLNNALAWTTDKADIIEIEPTVTIADFVNWNAKSFYFFDNNNNILEFIVRFDLDNKSDSAFSSSSILSISEVGIASENVLSEIQQISEKYNLAYFSKQPKMKNFSVLGNDNGLLIFVGTNRNWYPTNILSERFWTCVKIKNRDTVFNIEFE